jgi:cation diffusion facilitator family transporter
MKTSMDTDRSLRFGMADRVIAIGFWINAILMVMKLLAGHFGHSEAVFADGMESAADFVAILASIVALKLGRKPVDDDHPYGHGKAESIAAILVSLVIFTTGAGILYKAIMTIVERDYAEPQLIAVLAALATIIIKETLFRYTRRVSKKLESPAADRRQRRILRCGADGPPGGGSYRLLHLPHRLGNIPQRGQRPDGRSAA